MAEKIVDMRFENASMDTIVVTQDDGTQLVYYCGLQAAETIMRHLMEISKAGQCPKYQEIVKRGYDSISEAVLKCWLEVRQHTFEERQKAEQKRKQDANARAKLFYEEYRQLVNKYEIEVADSDDTRTDYVWVDDQDFHYYDVKGE